MTAEIRQFVDPSKMAEYKEVVEDRQFAFDFGIAVGKRKARREGFQRGLAWGIFGTALFFITVYAIGQVVG